MFQLLPQSYLGRESCGLSFPVQIVEIKISPDSPALFWLRDTVSGRLFPVQKSQQNLARGFLKIGIEPFQEFHLEMASGDTQSEFSPLDIGSTSLANEKISLHLAPDCDGPLDALQVAGPIVSIGLPGQKPRGTSFFDASSRVLKTRGQWLETGPLRAVWEYRVEFEDGGFYKATVSLDVGDDFAVIEEEFGAESGAQLVWDFAGEDWPAELFLLDPTPGGTFRRLHSHFDARHARLAAWTQYQQLHDLSDGFALLFEDDFLGLVTLEGGSWRGNRLNHIEAWTRRFWCDDRRTRRGEPWDAKADSMPGPEPIPARGEPVGTSRFCLESWIGAENGVAGRRKFALVTARREQLFPGAKDGKRGDGSLSGHFEKTADRERYRREQSLLRQIHIQRGMLPLQELAFKSFDWPAEIQPGENVFAYSSPLLVHHLHHYDEDETQRIKQMKEYLASRVYGLWEGGGASHSNCVVGREIAPQMFHFELLARSGRLSGEEKRLLRAHFAFLCHLFHSDNYYPGAATMQPNGALDSVEPTLAGMANQNFLTDVLCVAGTGAQIFSNHPDAMGWRERFGTLWQRQLEFHRYSESGVWEESHTYFLHVLHTVLPLLLRRRDDGAEKVGEGFQDPRFQSLCASIATQLTPRHSYSEGFRHILAWGDHEAGRHQHHVAIFSELARSFAPHNFDLSRQLAWVSVECGGEEIEGVPSQPMKWKSGPIEGLGFCFRTQNEKGTESLLALRAGGAWGHHHHDDGSIQFFAHGQALVVDAAFGNAPGDEKRKVLASGHSRWSLRDAEPFDYFWRFNRGWICAQDAEGTFPFAVAWTPVFMISHGFHVPSPLWPFIRHWRIVVQLAPDAFLIVDESDATLPQVVRFQLPGRVSIENGRVVTQNDDVKMHIVALTTSGEVRMGLKDIPRQAGKDRFGTQEVLFEMGLAPRSAILVAASETLEAKEENGVWHLAGNSWAVTIRFEATTVHLVRPDGEKCVLDERILRPEV